MEAPVDELYEQLGLARLLLWLVNRNLQTSTAPLKSQVQGTNYMCYIESG